MGRLGRSFLLMILGDSILTFAAYALAFIIRYGNFPERNWDAMLRVLPFCVVVTLLMLLMFNTYRDLHRPLLEVAGGTVLAVVLAVLLTGVASYLNVEARALPRGIWLLGGALLVLLLPAFRLWFVRDAKRRYFNRPAIVVSHVYNDWDTHFPSYIRIKACVEPSRVLSGKEDVSDSLILVAADVLPQERQALLEWAALKATDLYFIPSVYEVLLSGSHLTKWGAHPLISVRPLMIQPEFAWLKRALDLISAVVLIILSSPAWIVVPLAIRWSSKGPILFTQERLGQGGAPFVVYKFRTMVVDAEKSTGPVWASRNDPRITGVGRFLRSTRLDELPQLFNVLKGEMSLVGPRPERPVFVDQFASQNPGFRLRLLVKPGLTGLAQVMGRYDSTPDDKLRYDLLYIARYSIWLDIRILLWTAQVVLFPQSLTDRPPQWLEELDWQAS